MASIYDNINTAKDLVREVMAHGRSTKQEDIVRMQDIFGHSSIEELAALANDIGRNDANGNPDPKGTWSSGRKETRSTFYSILFSIWNYEDATRFWNQHTNPEHEKLEALEVEFKTLRTRNEQLTARRDELLEDAKRGTEYMAELNNRLTEAVARAEAAEAEIIQLKAKLYDLITKA